MSDGTNGSLRVQRIEAKAFKAFRNLDFTLDGRHLLAYGGNGAGKSSLYWLLYTLLQSGQKQTPEVTKYFDPDQPEHLLNVHSDATEQSQAHISVTLDNHNHATSQRYTLSASQHGTRQVPDMVKANLASDFVTYRILFNFYRFRNSEAIDLWPVFESEILPFCYTIAERDLEGLWRQLRYNNSFTPGIAGPAKKRYDTFDANATRLNTALTEVLQAISTQALRFYQQHFAADDLKEVKFGLVLRSPVSMYHRKAHRFDGPTVGFEVQLGGKKLARPHTFLNEAKLTQLALSVRFGATLAHLQDAPTKLLVLDDLLISLDMGNRMKVAEIILSETFAEHQKIILTHDLGFFNEFRRRIGGAHTDWSFQHFKTMQSGDIALQTVKNEIQKAEDHLNGRNLDEAATQLRKSAENSAKQLREWLTKEKLPVGEFFSLTENLGAARKKLLQKLPKQLHEKVLNGTPIEVLRQLVPEGTADLPESPELTAEIRGKIASKRGVLRNLITNTHWSAMENIRLIDRLLETTQRVLNPGAHGGEAPLYEAEIENALVLIRQLQQLSESNAAP
ncbi:MAG: hypothetical protein ABIR13_08640 [Polaromonas sp.]